jgi:hypothetical protein
MKYYKQEANMTNDEIEELVGLKDTDKNMLKARKNGLLLTDNQVNTLGRYNIDVAECKSMEELIYKINDASRGYDDDDYDELEYLAEQLQERNYYENTHK